MRVLFACEKSGRGRRAFRERGHDAYSCDLAQADDGSPHHIVGDAIEIVNRGIYRNSRKAFTPWDLVVAHPPCTRLALSGVLRLYRMGKKVNGIDPAKWQEMIAAAKFFAAFFDYKGKLCVENPRQHGYAVAFHGIRWKPQVIQPHDFGDDASKTTCLWLQGLPPLVATHTREEDFFAATGPQPRMIGGLPRYANQTDSGQNKLAPSPTRASLRAVTYAGIAAAMAEQWG